MPYAALSQFRIVLRRTKKCFVERVEKGRGEPR